MRVIAMGVRSTSYIMAVFEDPSKLLDLPPKSRRGLLIDRRHDVAHASRLDAKLHPDFPAAQSRQLPREVNRSHLVGPTSPAAERCLGNAPFLRHCAADLAQRDLPRRSVA